MVATVTRELVSVNPATLEPVGSVRRTEPGELPGIVASARAAQERWRALGPAARGRVLKPSELTPLSGDWVRRVLEEAGVPAGLVQVVHGEGPVGEALVGDAGIAKVFFTGSVSVGRRVAAAAGARGCPVVLELGGK